MSSVLHSLGPDDLVVNGRVLPLEAAVLIKLNLDKISEELLSILGKDQVDGFYGNYEPQGNGGRFHLVGMLARWIPACCRVSGDKRISLDAEWLLGRLEAVAGCVKAGEVPFSLSLRITNIDIETDFDLPDGVHFHRLSPDIVLHRYPVERQFTSTPSMVEQHWREHCVEAVISGHGKPADVQQRYCGFEQTDVIVSAITNAFLFASRKC
jgi:hypothetical protein